MNTLSFLSNKGLGKLSIVIAAALAPSSLLHATVVVSNLGVADGSGWSVYGELQVGMSFTVGTDYSSWNLDSVDIRAFDSGASTTDFVIELHADDGTGKPAVASLLTFTGAIPTTIDNYNFTPNSSFTLHAGTTYWLTAESLDEIGYGWAFTETSGGEETTALTGWSIGNNVARSVFGGFSWGTFNEAPAKFAINATGVAVPEPSSLLLLCIGSVATFRRRRV